MLERPRRPLHTPAQGYLRPGCVMLVVELLEQNPEAAAAALHALTQHQGAASATLLPRLPVAAAAATAAATLAAARRQHVRWQAGVQRPGPGGEGPGAGGPGPGGDVEAADGGGLVSQAPRVFRATDMLLHLAARAEVSTPLPLGRRGGVQGGMPHVSRIYPADLAHSGPSGPSLALPRASHCFCAWARQSIF